MLMLQFVAEIGANGFEPSTSCSQGRRASQAALRPARDKQVTIDSFISRILFCQFSGKFGKSRSLVRFEYDSSRLQSAPLAMGYFLFQSAGTAATCSEAVRVRMDAELCESLGVGARRFDGACGDRHRTQSRHERQVKPSRCGEDTAQLGQRHQLP